MADLVGLPPLMSQRVRTVLDEGRPLLFELIEHFGSPLYILLPEEFRDNIDRFSQVLESFNLDGEIWYACKVNKSKVFLEVAALRGIGIDVASIHELRYALGRGIRGGDIGISGPRKDPRLLLLAIQHGCTISVDIVEELFTIAEIGQHIPSLPPANVMLRLSGWPVTSFGRSDPFPQKPEPSRFGIPLVHTDAAFEILARPSILPYVRLVGIMFHIDNHSPLDRAYALAECVKYLLHARDLGHPCNQIDVGGGFSVRYISLEAWQRFRGTYAASLEEGGSPLMFRNKSFGLLTQDGNPASQGNFYRHDAPYTKENFLAELLSAVPSNAPLPVADLLRKHDIRLIIEPGRSLLDQAGLTMALVKGTRESPTGDPLLLCDMNISHLFEQMIGSEYTVDPVLVKQEDDLEPQSHFAYHLVGNLCLESDILSWRRIPFPSQPRPGDLLGFVNTAPYQMDFVESRIHQFPLPERIVIHKAIDGGLQWKQDSLWSILDMVQRASLAYQVPE